MSDDVVLLALRRFERMTRAHRYGGQLGAWRLAKDALQVYQERVGTNDPRQMTLTLRED